MRKNSPNLFKVIKRLGLFLLLLFAIPSFAQPVFESLQSNEQSWDAPNVTVNKPTGTVADDLLLAVISTDGNQAVTAPAGWITIDVGSSPNNAATLATFYKIATASEPASYQFAWPGGERNTGTILRYSNINTSNPIDVLTAITATGNSNTPTSPDLTAVSSNTTVVYAFAADGNHGNVTTAPAGTTGRYANRAGSNPAVVCSAGIADKTLTSGSTGTGAFNMGNGNAEEWRAITIILNNPTQ